MTGAPGGYLLCVGVVCRRVPPVSQRDFWQYQYSTGIKVLDCRFHPQRTQLYRAALRDRGLLREIHHASTRPLIATALKPLGLDAKSLGKMAYDLALGGMDLIKDDQWFKRSSFCAF